MADEKRLEKISRMQKYFLEQEMKATDSGIRRYYSGVAEGLGMAYELELDELPFNFIRDGN